MIHLLNSAQPSDAQAIVEAALRRSCGNAQVHLIGHEDWASMLRSGYRGVLAAVQPDDTCSELIHKTLQSGGCKVLLFGALPPHLAQALGAAVLPLDASVQQASKCPPAAAYSYTESPLRVIYREIDAVVRSPLPSRPFLRYDFTDEWNNLGYGAIRTDGSIWSLCQQVLLPSAHSLADVVLNGNVWGTYAGLWLDKSSLLWFNRPVGPVDSSEWRVVEDYLAHFQWPEAACQPVLAEIPWGFDGAVTMRLDCDEDVESARPLFNAYRELGIPFSLALHGKVLSDLRHHTLPKEVLQHGGAVLSHTATHAPDWGGSYEAAAIEGRTSMDQIAAAIGHRVRYAVSPFHQTPGYARSALADVGYLGCIGGIIRNDPDFLMARSGAAPGSSPQFVGHSQQCMLHGDCMLAQGDPLAVYEKAFELAQRSRTFFGYLDHPFSERYQYGWATEDQRVQMHREFVGYIRQRGTIWFANEDDALDFLRARANIQVEGDVNQYRIAVTMTPPAQAPLSVEYGGRTQALTAEGISL